MKNMILVMIATLSFGASAFAADTFTSGYTASGVCGEYKADNHSEGAESGPAYVTFAQDGGATMKWAFVASGPTNDGANGCGNFKAMLECASKTGVFRVIPAKNGPIFKTDADVIGFKCI